MTTLVLDASAAVRLAMAHTESDDAQFDAVFDAASVIAPSLIFAEVGNAIWKYVRADELPAAAALETARLGWNLVNEAIDDSLLVVEALDASTEHGHPVYDALYAVLARRYGCPVFTVDERLRTLLGRMGVDEAPL